MEKDMMLYTAKMYADEWENVDTLCSQEDFVRKGLIEYVASGINLSYQETIDIVEKFMNEFSLEIYSDLTIEDTNLE